MNKLEAMFGFDRDGELDSVERMEMYQFMDDPANSDSNYFFKDDNGLNVFKDLEDEENEWDEFEDEQDPFEDPDGDEWDEFEDEDDEDDDDEDEEDEEDVDLFGEDEVRAELEEAGLNYDELENMDLDERSEMLEDAGLDPDDYDF